ncbi:MAG: MAPEG family protein [Proteobacteria bacterium]|nr:MAPEG family protein [Pseudomonadota bacterium]
MMNDKQRGVVSGALPAYVVTFAVVGFAAFAPPAILLPAGPFPATLQAALSWGLLPALCLVGNIAAMANHRFYSPADIDGSGLTVATPKARIIQAMLQNTLEQAVLASIAYAVWASTMPEGWQAVVPAAALLFAGGRALFWYGYERGAPGRAMGFGLTFYPTMLMLAACVLRAGWRLVA